MSDNSACDCESIDLFTGDFKSSASSLTFTMCDGGVSTKVPADTVGDYLTSIIYGDASGDPPSEGCYSVCYDSNGVQSIVNSATQAELEDFSSETQSSLSEIIEVVNNPITFVNPARILSGSSGSGSIDMTSFGIPSGVDRVILDTYGIDVTAEGTASVIDPTTGGYIRLIRSSGYGGGDATGSSNQGVYPLNNGFLDWIITDNFSGAIEVDVVGYYRKLV